jgi:adenylosuccinate synthase
VLHRAEPVYRELPGWCSDLSGARTVSDLPPQARAYLEAIAEYTGVPVSYAGVGPGREQYVPLEP